MSANISEIGVHALAKMRAEGSPHILLDVREPQEVATCAIDGALMVPMQSVPERLSEIPQAQTVVVMCHHGGRSAAVTNFLMGQGYTDVHNLAGGIDAWVREIDTAMPRY